jgi:hypothetical protein
MYTGFIMKVSTLGSGTALFVLAGYSYLRSTGVEVDSFNWIPLLCLGLFMLLASIGLASLHWVITSEILEQKVTMQKYVRTHLTLPFLPDSCRGTSCLSLGKLDSNIFDCQALPRRP